MAPNPSSHLRSTLIKLLIIVSLGAFVHSFMLTDSFKTLDDNASIVNNPIIKDFANIKQALTTSYFGDNSYWRPLVFISYMIEYALFGLNPYYYYVTNLLIHLLSAIVVFFLMRLLYDRDNVPFFTALLFATHPVNWEPVANVPGRSILLSALFYFLAFLLFCHYRQRKKHPLILTLSLASFALSLLSKESGIMLPALIVAYLWIFEKPAGSRIARFYPSLPFFALAGAYMIARQMLGMVSLYYSRTLEYAVLGFLTFLRSVLTHLRLFILPVDLHFDRARPMFRDFAEPELIATIGIVGIAAYLLLKWRRRLAPAMVFFFLWFCIDLFPVSQIIVSIGTQAGMISTAEHFLYSAGVGIFALMTLAAQRLYQRNLARPSVSARLLQFAYGGFYLFLVLTTVRQNILASSELAMLAQTMRYNPANARMAESYGYALAQSGAYVQAEAYFRRVLALEPGHARARISLGKVLCDQDRCAEGLLEYEKVTDPPDALKQILESNKKVTYAIVLRQYEELLNDQPLNERLHYSLGIVYAKTHRIEEAIAAFREAIRLKPDFKEALFNLASLYDGIARHDLAIDYFERSLAVPGDKELDDFARSRIEGLRR